MTVHTTTAGHFAVPTCPQCGNVLVAPTTAGFDGAGCVRHVWTCDECRPRLSNMMRQRFGGAATGS
jgi:hypothetical protein